MSGLLRHYARLGYAHGRALGHGEGDDYCTPGKAYRCSACDMPFSWAQDDGGYTEQCDCGCRAEYEAAKRRGYGSHLGPMTVRAYVPGYVTMGGDCYPSRILEERDAWSASDAKRAARYLKDEYAHHRENGARATVIVQLSYVSRSDGAQ
jgi:hypothetical protein